MTNRVVWKNNGIVSLKLRDNLYTLGQMLGKANMRFFNIKSIDGNWCNIDLDKIEPIFTLFIGKVVLQNLVDTKIDDKTVKPNLKPLEKHWISANINYDGGPLFKGGDLIDIGEDVNIGSTQGNIIKQNLSLEADREIIETHELTNIYGDNHVSERLLNFFDTGKDVDALKAEVFAGL